MIGKETLDLYRQFALEAQEADREGQWTTGVSVRYSTLLELLDAYEDRL